MKRTSTLVLLILFISGASAQDFGKGTFLLGGTAGVFRQTYQTGEDDKTKYSTLSLNPSIGKFYRDNRMAGINLFFNRSKRTDDLYKSDLYGAGFFLRQYKPLGKSFYLYAEENASFFKGKTEQVYASSSRRDETRQTAGSIHFYPGVAYGLSKKFMVEVALVNVVSISYSRSIQDTKYTMPGAGTDTRSVNSSWSLDTGLSDNALSYIVFGIRYAFR